MTRPRISRIYTVQGITANLRALSERFGVPYQSAHARMFKCGWTVEQALGLAPRPPPKPRGNRVCATALVNGPRLAPDDGLIYADHIGVKVQRDGNAWCATRGDFQNLQESPAGFGSTVLEALSELAKELKYVPSKMWGATFHDLVKA